MTTIISAADAAQFLSLVPHLLGCTPRESLVLIPFAGDRSMGAMRFDLPPVDRPGDAPDECAPDECADDARASVDEPADATLWTIPDDTVERFASTALGMVCRLPDATGLTAVVYTSSRFDDTGRMPHRDLLDALAHRADTAGLHVTDLLCVAADAWASACDPRAPHEGRSLDEIDSGTDAAPWPLPDGDQTAGADLPPVDFAEKERVGRAMESVDTVFRILAGATDEPGTHAASWADERDDAAQHADVADTDDEHRSGELRIDPQAIAAAASVDDVPELYEAALRWDLDAVGAYDIAVLGWCLSRPSMRDVALVQWSGTFDDGDEALDAQLRWESGHEYPAHLAMRMWGEGSQPEPARLAAALALTMRVAASVPRAAQPGPLAMCAWLSWALGRSTHADLFARQACDIEPEHGLSEIVRSFVGAGHLPDWAFHRRRDTAAGRAKAWT